MKAELEQTCRLAWGAYVFLREGAATLAARSATAKLLATPGAATAALALSRAREELEELRGVLAGTHSDPFVLEVSQVWYWCCVSALLSGLSYDDWSPHQAWRGDRGGARAPECGRILAEAGRAMAGRLEPREALRYDLVQLRAKDYLADFFAQQDGGP